MEACGPLRQVSDGWQVKNADRDRARNATQRSNPQRAGDVGCTLPKPPAHPLCISVREVWAKGAGDCFGFTAGALAYDTDPTRPIGDWKEAWEKAKERAGAILSGKAEEEASEPLECRFHDLRPTAV